MGRPRSRRLNEMQRQRLHAILSGLGRESVAHRLGVSIRTIERALEGKGTTVYDELAKIATYPLPERHEPSYVFEEARVARKIQDIYRFSDRRALRLARAIIRSRQKLPGFLAGR